MKLNLKYPVLLVHGMGFRDDMPFSYWGRIPKALADEGAQIFHGNQDAVADIETNAGVIKETIEDILEKTGAEKVNIIAHSKGGLDSRYAIAHLGLEDKVASLTTIATPHNGSKTVDFLLKLPDFAVRFISMIGNFWYKRFGDRKPDCYRVFHAFTTEKARLFNENTPVSEKVYCQSYAFVNKHSASDAFLWLPGMLVKWIEGENDGLLTPESVKWANFRGIVRAQNRRGVSHLDEIDFRRSSIEMTINDHKTDILKFYKDLLYELADMGF